MTARVKICGVNSPAAFDAAVQAGADWVGFVFFSKSPRVVLPTDAAALSARHRGGPGRVGLFVEPNDDEVGDVLGATRLDALQVYAPLSRAAALRRRFGIPVWWACPIGTAADLPSDVPGIDALVIEAPPPLGSTRPGGNAVRLEWPVLRGWTAPAPWLLAGGLSPGNVANAIRESGATAVDVSSGVETRKGVKDGELIHAFVAAARAA